MYVKPISNKQKKERKKETNIKILYKNHKQKQPPPIPQKNRTEQYKTKQ